MDIEFENEVKSRGFDLIVGVDEAGRGPLAGPVVASAVALRKSEFTAKMGDSKTLSAKQREEAFHEIHENAYVGIGIVSETVIDRSNILDATFLAMTNAVENLILQCVAGGKVDSDFYEKVCLLVDGHLFRSDLPYTYQTVIKGDSTVLSIACASIVAKVTRDRILDVYDKIFPDYGFKNHKGYPTLQHRRALDVHGPSLIHRRTFKHTL